MRLVATTVHQQAPVGVRQNTSAFPVHMAQNPPFVMISGVASTATPRNSVRPQNPAQKPAAFQSTNGPHGQEQFFQVQGNIMIRQPQQQHAREAETVKVKTEASDGEGDDLPMHTQVITARIPNNAGQAAILTAVGDQLQAAQGVYARFLRSPYCVVNL
jgi:hypothetical protein